MKNKQLVLLWLYVSCLGAPAVAQMGMGSPTPLTAAQFANVRSGQPVEVAVRIDGLKRTTIRAHLLERESGGDYKLTGKAVQLYFADGTPVVMGSTSDIAPGAIVLVYGVSTKRWQADAKRIVVMTHYVKIH